MILRAALRKFPYYAILLIPLTLAAAGNVVVDLSIVRGKPEGGVRTVRAERGDALELKVRSDEAIEVHVHGYDVKVKVSPGGKASMKLSAQLVGRFPVTAHLHGKGGGKASEPTLLYLEVHPR